MACYRLRQQTMRASAEAKINEAEKTMKLTREESVYVGSGVAQELLTGYAVLRDLNAEVRAPENIDG
jgi:hypothetical protein